MKRNRTLLLLFILALLLALLTIGSDYMIENLAQAYCYDNIAHLPENQAGVVLGTAKYIPGGHINLYYQYRIEAVVNLFNSSKIKYVLVSGDNALREYNEPVTIKRDLVKQGIPEEKIYLDYAGFRTLDSIIRAYRVFGLQKFTIISQPFQTERAVFIGRQKGLEVVGFNAQDVARPIASKMMVRETLARIKTLLDVYVLHQKPKYLGDSIKIPAH